MKKIVSKMRTLEEDKYVNAKIASVSLKFFKNVLDL